MLQKESAAVRLYLERAANARERASATVDETTRQFHQAMESKWMDLAASTAVVEHVDLFLQSREFRLRLSPSDLCPDCHERMPLKAVKTTAALEEHTFRCLNCGSERTRRSRANDFPSIPSLPNAASALVDLSERRPKQPLRNWEEDLQTILDGTPFMLTRCSGAALGVLSIHFPIVQRPTDIQVRGMTEAAGLAADAIIRLRAVNGGNMLNALDAFQKSQEAITTAEKLLSRDLLLPVIDLARSAPLR
jgi:hypothetical protein